VNRPSISRRLLIVIVLSLIWAAVLGFNLIPQLRGDFGWRWPYQVPREPVRVLPLAFCLLFYLSGGWFFMRQPRPAALIAWAAVGSIGLTLAGLYVAFNPVFQLYSVTLSAVAGGWHYAAAHLDDLSAALRTWPSYIHEAGQTISSHLGVAPPGAVVIYSIADGVLARWPGLADALGQPLRAWQCQEFRLLGYSNAQFASAWLGVLMPAWASLAVVPIYQFGRRTFGEVEARWSVLWWPLVPSLLMFTPSLNTVFPVFAMALLALLAAGLQADRPSLVLAAGLVMSAMTFVTFAVMPLLLLAGLLTLGYFWLHLPRRSWHWPLRMGAWFGLGLASVWIIYYLLTGVTFLEIAREIGRAHLGLERPYWPWLILHLNDFFMFAGWPLTLVAGLGVWRAVERMRTRAGALPADLVAVAGLITLIGLDVSGTLRGESGRILLYLAPLLLLVAARVLKDEGAPAQWAVTGTQALVVLGMVAFLRVMGSEFHPAPAAAPEVAATPLAASPSGAVFADALRLDSFAGQVVSQAGANGQPQPMLNLWLDWYSTGQVDTPYYLSLLPVAPGGQPTQATLVQPFDQKYPTTCWLPASGLIRARVDVPLADLAASGDWWVSLRLLDGGTGQPAQVTLPDGSQDQQVGLGPFPAQ
jgi:hypothetical protein